MLSLQTAMKISTQRSKSRPQRLLAGAGALVFFAVFFALPLYAAATLCTMPCCHHHDTAAPVVSADSFACATDCVVSGDTATAATSAQFVAPADPVAVHVPATPVVSLVAAADFAAAVDIGPPHASPSAPLHVLNSVFRI